MVGVCFQRVYIDKGWWYIDVAWDTGVFNSEGSLLDLDLVINEIRWLLGDVVEGYCASI